MKKKKSSFFVQGRGETSRLKKDKDYNNISTWLPPSPTLMAISRAVDGIIGRLNVPSHRIHRRASVYRSILALRRAPAELDLLRV
jgi:hypothetical protein